MSDRADGLPTREDVFKCIDLVATFVRDPERDGVLKNMLAGVAVDSLVVFSDTFERGQTIQNVVNVLFTDEKDSIEARSNLVDILEIVNFSNNFPAAQRTREALGMPPQVN